MLQASLFTIFHFSNMDTNSYLSQNDANAATLLAALEVTCPFVALQKLMGLSEKIPRVCLINSSDLCPANARMKHAIAYKLAVHNAASLSRGEGIILFVDVHCSSHVLHNIVEKAFALHLFIPRMHSIAFSLSIPRTYAQVFRLLRTLVEHDLALVFSLTPSRPRNTRPRPRR